MVTKRPGNIVARLRLRNWCCQPSWRVHEARYGRQLAWGLGTEMTMQATAIEMMDMKQELVRCCRGLLLLKRKC
jgi:hypothetical protein